MKESLSKFSFLKTCSLLLLFTLLVSTFTGCGNQKEAEKLADTGITTAEQMAEFYDSLAQDTIDSWEFEAFISSLRQGDRDDEKLMEEEDHARYQRKVEELQKRAKMARQLATTYRALKNLVDYDSAGEVRESAKSLSGSLFSLGVFGGINPTTIVSGAAGDLAEIDKIKDIRKGERLIFKTLGSIKDLMEKEKAVYQEISGDRERKAGEIIKKLIESKAVAPLPLLKRISDEYGLSLVGSNAAITDAKLASALIATVKVKATRQVLLSGNLTFQIQNNLEKLVQNHQDFKSKSGLNLADLINGLERAKFYLDEINKLRSLNSQTK